MMQVQFPGNSFKVTVIIHVTQPFNCTSGGVHIYYDPKLSKIAQHLKSCSRPNKIANTLGVQNIYYKRWVISAHPVE